MKTCLKDYHIQNSFGQKFNLEKGKEYLTSSSEKVFSQYACRSKFFQKGKGSHNEKSLLANNSHPDHVRRFSRVVQYHQAGKTDR